MATTKDPSLGLLYTLNGSPSAHWNTTVGQAVSLSYIFLSSAPSYYTGAYAISNFRALNSYEKSAASAALTLLSSIVNVTFTEEASVGASTDITFGVTSSKMSASSYAYAYVPYQTATAASSFSGDVWINKSIVSTATTYQPSGYGYLALIHEMGHSMGLKHPFEEGYTLDPSIQNRAYTVMSYTAAPKSAWLSYTSNGGSYSWTMPNIEPETYMLYDIAALQALYGANNSYNSGANTYTFDPTKPFFKTIWDGGGTDTIDISNFSLNSSVDLQAGNFSSIRYQQDIPALILANLNATSKASLYDGTNNLAIAYGTIIENATGGTGDDTLIGNGVANLLTGGAGNDTLYGGIGNDSLVGGAGNDRLVLSVEDASSVSLTGGLGQDIYAFNSVSLLTGARVVQDFATGSSGDAIDADKLLTESMKLGYSTGNPFSVSLGYLKLTQSASDTLLQWDKDGASKSAYSLQTVLTLKGVQASSLTNDNFVQDFDLSGTGSYTPEISGALVAYLDSSADDLFAKKEGVIENSLGSGATFSLLTDAGVSAAFLKSAYGTLTLNAKTGAYSFTPTDIAIEALTSADVISQTFKARIKTTSSSLDTSIVLSVAGADDQVIFSGATTGKLIEDSKTNVMTGKLLTKDLDVGDGATIIASSATSGYGSFAIDAKGAWTYTLNNSSDAVQTLRAKQTYNDSFTVTTKDGSSKEIVMAIAGANDLTTITGTITGNVSEDTLLTAEGVLSVTDKDAGETGFNPKQVLGVYGVLNIEDDGHWVYTLNNEMAIVQALTDTSVMAEKLTVTTVGAIAQTITITVKGAGKTVTGTSKHDSLVGGVQDDLLKGGVGNDTMQGGTGHDTYEVDSMNDLVVENAAEGYDRIKLTLADKKITTYSLANHIENLTLVSSVANLAVSGNDANNHLLGGSVNDNLSGLAGNDLLSGMAGNDLLNGGVGVDIILGGLGNDSLTGGAGGDAFVLDSLGSATNLDVITDFSVSEDVIYLNIFTYKGLGLTEGSLSATQFVAGATATAATSRILYDAASGTLSYDADGTGKVAAVQIASLSSKPAGLTSDHFALYNGGAKGDLSVIITGVQASDSVLLY